MKMKWLNESYVKMKRQSAMAALARRNISHGIS
jgi:hypothetical protein